MFAIIILTTMLCAALIGSFIYLFLTRIFLFWVGKRFKEKNKTVKVIITVLSVCLALLAVDIFSTVSIVILHIVALALITELINLAVKKICCKFNRTYALWKKIYLSGILPIFVASCMLIYGYWNINYIRTTHYTIYTEKTLKEENYKVVLIADLHFGNATNEEKLKVQCERISKENADIIVLCGDIVDESTTFEEMQTAFEILGEIKSKYGIYFVFGNHDISGYMKPVHYTQNDIRNALSENKITVLEDSGVQIDSSFSVIGRIDRSETRLDIESLIKNESKDDFLLVLDHQPFEYKESAEADVDLLLSGHTHAGQIWPAGYFIEWLGFADSCYGYTKKGDFQAIVTSGISAWGYPIRTDGISEYAVINIQEKK